MSVTIASTLLPYGALGRLDAQALALSTRSAALSEQSASGLISPDITDLGSATEAVLNLQPQLASLQAYAASATASGSRLGVAAAALSSVGAIASALVTSLTSLAGTTGSGLATAIVADASTARASLGSLGALLNTQSGDSYVFGGTATDQAPVPEPGALTDGALATSIDAAVGDLVGAGADATTTAILSLAGSTASGQPFSASLSTDPVSAAATAATAPIGAGEVIPVSVPATGGAAASAMSTGSPIRDLVAVLSAVAGLDAASTGSDQFASLLSNLRSIASTAAAGITNMAASVGVDENRATATATTYDASAAAMTAQIGSLTSVDLASVSAQLATTNTALQASYQLIADMKSLSLADYL